MSTLIEQRREKIRTLKHEKGERLPFSLFGLYSSPTQKEESHKNYASMALTALARRETLRAAFFQWITPLPAILSSEDVAA